MVVQPYTTEEIKVLLEINKLTRKALIQRITLIGAILEYGGKLRSGRLRLIVGEDTLNRWLTEPGAAQAEIERSKKEIKEIEAEISNLEAQL